MKQATIQEQVESLRKMTLKADYLGALKGAVSLRKKYPGHFDVEYMYAKLLGDYADELAQSKRKKMKREASEILRKLCRRLKGKPADVKFWVRTNYYYQRGLYRDLVRVGYELVEADRLRGLYSIAGGAALHAEQLIKKRNRTAARKYARLSIENWKKYFKVNPKEDFYFPYSLQAVGHAILGESDEMESLLNKAQKLSGQKANYWEFAEIRSLEKKTSQL